MKVNIFVRSNLIWLVSLFWDWLATFKEQIFRKTTVTDKTMSTYRWGNNNSIKNSAQKKRFFSQICKYLQFWLLYFFFKMVGSNDEYLMWLIFTIKIRWKNKRSRAGSIDVWIIRFMFGKIFERKWVVLTFRVNRKFRSKYTFTEIYIKIKYFLRATKYLHTKRKSTGY